MTSATKTPSKKQRAAQEKADALDAIRRYVKPGDTIYCILEHVSTSGMRRRINFYVPITEKDGTISMQFLSGYIGKALGYRRPLYNRSGRMADGIEVDGCGMDMGFAVVYHLGTALWPNGTPTPHGHRNGEPDSTGGYALNHRWL